jgi:RecA-family ATPase
LAGLLTPSKDGWLVPVDEFSAQPAPISWLVKRWLQSQALIMVHGPSGGGKTFVVLDWCLRMASGIDNWCGQKVKAGNVVYLAGEGHHGLRGRIAAWKHHNSAGRLSMWLSKDGCDLNTPAGYLQVVEQIRLIKEKPEVIVVDTLHRFLSGDENSAQDAKTMLDACGNLMQEFNCSVILVHHTGVSEEAQHRARGSSAWRGALDIEISVVPGKKDVPMQ